jgi:death-on-curing protein
MITLDDAVKIHSILIERFGGTKGVRDKNSLESALLRPYQTFDKKQLYLSPAQKAAAIIESIITNHSFLDGNKRFGYAAMRLTLLSDGMDIIASEDEKYDFVIKIAQGIFKYPDILNWINSKIIEN